jgi:hypothetical protein
MIQSQNSGEPPMRDFEGNIAEVRVRQPARLHSLTADGANAAEDGEVRLPPPDMPLITCLDEIELAELIERHIDYVDEDGRSVHLPMPFVRHYLRRFDRNEGGLPRVMAVLTLPLVLFDGTLLSGRGLNREYETVFRVPAELEGLSHPERCTGAAVVEAMRFLTDEWLCDVATDYAGKCVIIACALTIIERMLLPERPAFFVTAGQTRGGKTTTTNMIALAILGVRAPAAAWSAVEEERRKALFAYFCEGVPLLVLG